MLIGANKVKVLVRGGGDLASGVIYRLKRSGFPVIVTEIARPMVVRRAVSFAEAVFSGTRVIEGLTGYNVKDYKEAIKLADHSEFVPVIIDPQGEIIGQWNPLVIVDATMSKTNAIGTHISQAPLVIGLGPGFKAGEDVHAVIETKRGHYLGRVIYEGQAAPNTGIPGIVQGIGVERVIYAPKSGIFNTQRKLGEWIEKEEIFGYVDETPVKARISGIIRGLLKSGLSVEAGVKIGDIDPRKDIDVNTISDKALAVGGGVLEAIMSKFNNKSDN